MRISDWSSDVCSSDLWVQCPFSRLVAANVPCDGSTCRRPVGPIASLRSVPAPNPYSELGIKEKDSNEEYLVVRTGSAAGAWHDRRCFADPNTGCCKVGEAHVGTPATHRTPYCRL